MELYAICCHEYVAGVYKNQSVSKEGSRRSTILRWRERRCQGVTGQDKRVHVCETGVQKRGNGKDKAASVGPGWW